MNMFTVFALFPLVLAVHNAEELYQYDAFVRVYHGRRAERFVTKRVIRNGAIILTFAGVLLGLFTWMYRTPALVHASVTATLALTVNACGHVFVSGKAKELTPGTLSALLVVLPYGALVLCVARLPLVTTLSLTLLGLVIAPVAVAIFLFLGYCLARCSSSHSFEISSRAHSVRHKDTQK